MIDCLLRMRNNPLFKMLLSKLVKIFWRKELLRLIQKNGEDVTPTAQVLPKDKITLQVKKNISFIFQDVFRFVDIDRKQIKGHYKIYLNDVEATFFDEIKDGDRLELK